MPPGSAARLALVPEDDVPIPLCCGSMHENAYAGDDALSINETNSLLDVQSQRTSRGSGGFCGAQMMWCDTNPHAVEIEELEILLEDTKNSATNINGSPSSSKVDAESMKKRDTLGTVDIPLADVSVRVDTQESRADDHVGQSVDPTGGIYLETEFPSLNLCTATKKGSEIGTEVIILEHASALGPSRMSNNWDDPFKNLRFHNSVFDHREEKKDPDFDEEHDQHAKHKGIELCPSSTKPSDAYNVFEEAPSKETIDETQWSLNQSATTEVTPSKRPAESDCKEVDDEAKDNDVTLNFSNDDVTRKVEAFE